MKPPKTISSYSENNFGPIFKNTVIAFKPRTCVELGVLNGYSSMWIGLGLQHNAKLHSLTGHLYSYDLWDDYPYNHGNKEDVEELLKKCGVDKYVSLFHKDAKEVHLLYTEKQVDILHVDISNTGDIFNFIVEKWHPLLTMSGVLLFEGGSMERDSISWMMETNSFPIKKAIEANPIINSFYQYGTYDKFPSLTVLIKKGE